MTTDSLEAARTAHLQSIERFIARAEAVPDGVWDEPLAPGKWSPAQVAEHLRLTYEVALGELAGGRGLRIRSPWWLRPILRLRFLPVILRRGRIPRGARAPREIRPGDGPFPRNALLQALRTSAVRTGDTMAGRGSNGSGFTHHVFGRLAVGDALRFATVHNEHHTRQLSPEVRSPAG